MAVISIITNPKTGEVTAGNKETKNIVITPKAAVKGFWTSDGGGGRGHHGIPDSDVVKNPVTGIGVEFPTGATSDTGKPLVGYAGPGVAVKQGSKREGATPIVVPSYVRGSYQAPQQQKPQIQPPQTQPKGVPISAGVYNKIIVDKYGVNAPFRRAVPGEVAYVDYQRPDYTYDLVGKPISRFDLNTKEVIPSDLNQLETQAYTERAGGEGSMGAFLIRGTDVERDIGTGLMQDAYGKLYEGGKPKQYDLTFKNIGKILGARGELLAGNILTGLGKGTKSLIYTPEEAVVLLGMTGAIKPTPEEKILQSQGLNYGIDLGFKGISLFSGFVGGAGISKGFLTVPGKALAVAGTGSIIYGGLTTKNPVEFRTDLLGGALTYGLIGGVGASVGKEVKPTQLIIESKQAATTHIVDINKADVTLTSKQLIVGRFPSGRVELFGAVKTDVLGSTEGLGGGFITKTVTKPSKIGAKYGVKPNEIFGISTQTYIPSDTVRAVGVQYSNRLLLPDSSAVVDFGVGEGYYKTGFRNPIFEVVSKGTSFKMEKAPKGFLNAKNRFEVPKELKGEITTGGSLFNKEKINYFGYESTGYGLNEGLIDLNTKEILPQKISVRDIGITKFTEYPVKEGEPYSFSRVSRGTGKVKINEDVFNINYEQRAMSRGLEINNKIFFDFQTKMKVNRMAGKLPAEMGWDVRSLGEGYAIDNTIVAMQNQEWFKFKEAKAPSLKTGNFLTGRVTSNEKMVIDEGVIEKVDVLRLEGLGGKPGKSGGLRDFFWSESIKKGTAEYQGTKIEFYKYKGGSEQPIPSPEPLSFAPEKPKAPKGVIEDKVATQKEWAKNTKIIVDKSILGYRESNAKAPTLTLGIKEIGDGLKLGTTEQAVKVIKQTSRASDSAKVGATVAAQSAQANYPKINVRSMGGLNFPVMTVPGVMSETNNANQFELGKLIMKGGLINEFRSELKGGLKPELKGETRSELRGSLRNELRGELRSELRGDIRSELRGDLRSELRSDLASELRSELRSELKTNLKTNLITNLRTNFKVNLLPKIPTPVNQVLPFPGLYDKGRKPANKQLSELFNVFVRESKPKGKGKVSEYLVSKGALPYNAARNLGAEYADITTARTFRIVKAGKGYARDVAATERSFKFRGRVGRSQLHPTSFVERSKFAIDTSGERQGITIKGLLARRKKRFSLF